MLVLYAEIKSYYAGATLYVKIVLGKILMLFAPDTQSIPYDAHRTAPQLSVFLEAITRQQCPKSARKPTCCTTNLYEAEHCFHLDR
jgi:hypothetical protein